MPSPTGGEFSARGSQVMANGAPRGIPDPQSLDKSATAKAMADHAKTFWIGSLICKAAAGGLGILSGLFAILPIAFAVLTFAFALFDELLTWRSDMVKGDAEAFRRRLDAENSLG